MNVESGLVFLDNIWCSKEEKTTSELGIACLKGYCSASGFNLENDVTPRLVWFVLQFISQVRLKNANSILYSLSCRSINLICSLRLTNCGLTEFPLGIYHLANLKKIYVFDNKIKNIPNGAFENLNHKILVDLSCNEISRYSDLMGFYQNPIKVRLKISGNPLPEIHWGPMSEFTIKPYKDEGPNTVVVNEHTLLHLDENDKEELTKAVSIFKVTGVFKQHQNFLPSFSELEVLNYLVFNYFPELWSSPGKIAEVSVAEFQQRFEPNQDVYKALLESTLKILKLALPREVVYGKSYKSLFEDLYEKNKNRLAVTGSLELEIKPNGSLGAFLPDLSEMFPCVWELQITGFYCPIWLDKLSNLKILKLRRSQHYDIPAQIRYTNSLSLMHIIDSNIQRIPAWLLELENLKTLSLANGRIKTVEGQIDTMEKLSRKCMVTYSGNPIREAALLSG